MLPEQIGHLSLSFLASDLQVRRGGTAPTSPSAWPCSAPGRCSSAAWGETPPTTSATSRPRASTSGVRTSEALATARFTCTTDLDHSQIGTFYPGAMAEAAGIELAALGPVDLVVVAPNDPGAMLRHTDECRASDTAFAADPSQQLAFLDGESVRRLVDGAAYLFSNEYEAGLVRDKTGWSDDEVLERVGTRVTTHGAKGIVVTRRGEAEIRVPVAPAREVVEPTGVGDAFRAGFLTATAWGVGLDRATQVGALLATHVVETVGTQEYTLTFEDFVDRLGEAYGEVAADEVRPHVVGA